MEALLLLLEVEVLRGNIILPKVNHGISHLMFADDFLVFCKGDLQNLLMVEQVFNQFVGSSGLHISKEKSVLFLSGSCIQRALIFQSLGFKEGQFPIRYLGVPLLDRRLQYSDCSKLLDTLKSKITGWRNRLLSFAGRMELIKFVLYSSGTDWILAFSLPKKTIAAFNSIMSNFLWKSRIHSVSWETICRPKSEGGLGIRSMSDICQASTAKKAWSIISNSKTL